MALQVHLEKALRRSPHEHPANVLASRAGNNVRSCQALDRHTTCAQACCSAGSWC
jgi:hypothetical protein